MNKLKESVVKAMNKRASEPIPKDIEDLAKEHYNTIKKIISNVTRLPYAHIWQVAKIIETYNYKTEIDKGVGYLSYIKVTLPHASGLKIHQDYSFEYTIESSNYNDKETFKLERNYYIKKDGITLNGY